MTQKGVLYGVGVGPGNPKLLTLEAVDIMSNADIIAVPSGSERQTALSVAEMYIKSKPLIECPIPMTRDKEKLCEAYKAIADKVFPCLDEGKSVAYLTLGDPSVYSTYTPVKELAEAQGYETRTAAGVTSFCAAAARINRPLCKGKQRLLIVPMSDENIDECIDIKASKVFMRPNKSIAVLKEKLDKKGLTSCSTAISDCGLPDERIYKSLDEVNSTGYFTLVLTAEQQ